jgi:hypothetical protein
MTRFNVAGSDLNRNWLDQTDSINAPENYFLQQFLEKLIEQGHKPVLAIDFHNDGNGNLHLAVPKEGDQGYLKRMELFHQELIKETWVSPKFVMKDKIAGGGHFADGMLHIYGIDAFIFELNANYLEKLAKMPEINDWKDLGAKLNEVFYQYLSSH